MSHKSVDLTSQYSNARQRKLALFHLGAVIPFFQTVKAPFLRYPAVRY
jgi:hypothetical protein